MTNVFKAISIITICLGSGFACAPKTIPLSPPVDLVQPTASMVNGAIVRRPNELSRSVVALVMAGGRGQSLCSGTILDEQTILTAAHCVDHNPHELIIVFGPDVKTSRPDMRRPADAALQHPAWRRGQLAGDVALVRFQGGLPAGFGPVTLAGPRFPVPPYGELWMIGYGISNPERQGGAGTLRQTRAKILGLSRPDQLVVDERLSGACFGDSGGPAFTVESDRVVQVGLAHSVMNETCDMASLYTGIMLYADWIRGGVEYLARDAGA